METNYVYAGKCRNCGRREGWYFGQSGNISVLSFYESMDEKLIKGNVAHCDDCNARVVYDILFFGEQKDYKHLLDDIEKIR